MFSYALPVGLGLAMDAFAVSVVIGLCSHLSLSKIIRVAGAFGLFQALMPLLGWLLAQGFYDLIRDYDHWVAFLLLALIGQKMIREGRKNKDDCPQAEDPTSGLALLTLAVGTSIDALAVGVTFVSVEVVVLPTCGIIGGITFLLSVLGLVGAARIGVLVGHRMEILGGAVLIFLGIKILVEHLY